VGGVSFARFVNQETEMEMEASLPHLEKLKKLRDRICCHLESKYTIIWKWKVYPHQDCHLERWKTGVQK